MLKMFGQFLLGVAKSPTFWCFAALGMAIVYQCTQ